MNFRTLAKITLILIYLVIAAGAVVRMTGSGMGCPDWPKCFGYYIPPTEESELLWQANRTYKKGQVIIREESLWVAREDITTSAEYNPEHWEPYTRHDYAVFNPAHTWTEYINRLLGALAGLATLLLAAFSFRQKDKSRWIPILAILVVLGMGFQAWLGATVVYSVLAPVKITLHMLMALLLVAMMLIILYLTKPLEAQAGTVANPKFRRLLWIALGLTLIQVLLGTQVRQTVDEQVREFGESGLSRWLDMPGWKFYLHRSFSILVLLVNVGLFYLNRRFTPGFAKMNWVMLLLGLEILSGMLMYYIGFPFASQPVHLFVASVLFAVQFYLLLESKSETVRHKTL